MSEAEKLEIEVKRLRAEARLYKEQCRKLRDAANEYASISCAFLRGRPGRKHPAMVALRKLDRVIESSEGVDALIQSIMETV